MLKIYHNPRCSKSRETLAMLQEEGQQVEIVEYLKTPPKASELKEILGKLGIKPEQLLRKGEKLYKDSYKGKNLTDDAWVQVMVENPVLMERPIVVNNEKAALGRPPENVLGIL